MYGTCARTRVAAGSPDVKFHDVFIAITRSFINNNGRERHDTAQHAERINQLLDCFEYPEGRK